MPDVKSTIVLLSTHISHDLIEGSDPDIPLYSLLIEDQFRSLIDMILDEKIDDVLSVLDYGSENRKFVEWVLDTTNRKVMDISNGVDNVLSTYNGDRKAFALEYNSHKLFGIMTQVISGRDKMEVIKSSIKKITYRLSGARDWLNL